VINENAVIDVSDDRLKVLDGVDFTGGGINVTDEVLLANVRRAIRRPYPQVKPHPPNYDRVVLVGGGPSLASTEQELVELVRSGAKLVTMNGAYRWCLERNLQPRTQIIMDARPSNARFLEPDVPDCRYVLASQCAPETWDAVSGRSHVWMFHAATGVNDELKQLLDAHYLGNWYGIGGGVTVATRAIYLLRVMGYLRFDLFGIDCCWMDGAHHAYAQPENEHDRRGIMTIESTDGCAPARDFQISGWHLKQFEDFLHAIRINGDGFLLNVHGDGLLAYALRSQADDVRWSVRDAD